MCRSHEKLQFERVTLLKSLRPLAASVAGSRLKKTRSVPRAGDSGGQRNNKFLYVCRELLQYSGGIYNHEYAIGGKKRKLEFMQLRVLIITY